MAVFGVLTVCTGNICRSPMAEIVLRDGLRGIRGVEVMSAGTGAQDDVAIPAPAAAILAGLGLDAASHRSQYLEDVMLEMSDLVIAMTREHRSIIVKTVPRVLQRTFTAREFARLAEGLSDEEVAAACQGETEFDRLTAAVRLIASRRGSVPAPSGDQDDVVDPYGRSDETYRRSADELLPAVDQIVRVLRAAATGTSGQSRTDGERDRLGV